MLAAWPTVHACTAALSLAAQLNMLGWLAARTALNPAGGGVRIP